MAKGSTGTAGRQTLDTDAVIAAAELLVDRDGLDALTMTSLAAELGIRTPSLYKHVDSLDDVRRRLGLLGIRDLAEACRSAVLGHSRDAAFSALANAFRTYVLAHPGRYLAQADLGRRDDVDYWEAAGRITEAVLAVLASYGLDGDDAQQAMVAQWAAVHGFVTLEASGALDGYVDADAVFGRIVGAIARSVGSRAPLAYWIDHARSATAAAGTAAVSAAAVAPGTAAASRQRPNTSRNQQPDRRGT